ncbi:hypothetical protein, partial [Gordonia otitidis]
ISIPSSVLPRISFDSWALLDTADEVFIAAEAKLGTNAGVLVGKAQSEFGDGEYRTVADWSILVAEFLASTDGVERPVQAELPTEVPDMAGIIAEADDTKPISLDVFYQGSRVQVLAEFLDARDRVAADAGHVWDHQRAIRSELLYSGDVLTERAWFQLFTSRVWDGAEDDVYVRESVRDRIVSKLRDKQFENGLIPKHCAALRSQQDMLAVYDVLLSSGLASTDDEFLIAGLVDRLGLPVGRKSESRVRAALLGLRERGLVGV